MLTRFYVARGTMALCRHLPAPPHSAPSRSFNITAELSKAINYTLNEYDALCNYIRSADYAPDNNAIERLMRYISLSRRNSLFCGSHQGLKRAALIYSLACSCRLNNINSFEYFKDLLTKLIDINPNTDHETIRNLLPHKWQR